jgi:uncharacterized membrane protein YkvI
VSLSRFFAVYITPPSVFVAVLIGGGYGTGREIVEFFSKHGFVTGSFGLITSFFLFFLVLGATFDVARRLQAYEYSSFFKQLIGSVWWLYEVLYVLLAMLVLGVLSAAAGETMLQEFGLPLNWGYLLMLVLLTALLLAGRTFLQRVLTFWSAMMFIAFGVYLFFIFDQLGGATRMSVDSAPALAGIASGALYVMYNVAIAPVLLFSMRAFETRVESWTAAGITAFALVLPAFIFHWGFTAVDPLLMDQAVPMYWMIEQFAPSIFKIVFVVLLLGTLVQTGSGLIHGFIERVEQALADRQQGSLNRPARIGITIGALTISWLLAQFGLINLIGAGYSAMGVGFALVYIIPLLVRYFILRNLVRD